MSYVNKKIDQRNISLSFGIAIRICKFVFVNISDFYQLILCFTYYRINKSRDTSIQLGQLRLNPPGVGSKCGKRVERFSDFGKYKGNFRNHTTSLPTYRTLSKWGKWVDRLSDFGKYKGYIRNHSTSLPAYRTLSQVRGVQPQLT